MFVNPNHANETWSVGDTCYFYGTWDVSIIEARILDIDPETNSATLSGVSTPGTCRYPLTHIFRTRTAAMDALSRHNANQIKTYETSITTVQELLQFALDNPLSSAAEEYTDWEARAAFVSRAKDLLGIQLRC